MENENYILKEKVAKTATALQTIENLTIDLRTTNSKLDDTRAKLASSEESLRLSQKRLDDSAVGTFLVRLELMRQDLFPKPEKQNQQVENETQHSVKVIHEYADGSI